MRDVPVPPVPDGGRIAPPDFVGVGAQRAGTSWWFAGIARHPRVRTWPSGGHELHYFDRFWAADPTPDDLSGYARYFPRLDGEVTGEWTPRYMYDPWTPPLLARAAPDARLLVLLRDPVERLLSGLAHQETAGPLDEAHVTDAVQRGLYAGQLRRLLSHVPRERVLVLQFERCVADPRGQLRATFEFLGLDPADGDAVARRVNKSYRPRPALSGALLDELRRQYRDDAAELSGLVPDLDLSLWRSLA